MDKAEYRGQLKSLIMKYHPDHCLDETMKPLYSEITMKLTQRLHSLNKGKNRAPEGLRTAPALSGGKAPAVVRDQGYAYYKQGIVFYRKIHPSVFYRTRKLDKMYSGMERIDYEERLAKIREILIAFNISAYFFRKVSGEYSDSEWAHDARRKLALLEKLKLTYEKMLEAEE
jgi:hypothetical protein